MEIKYIKIETQTQKTFREFLDGKYLPGAVCERIMNDLALGDYPTPYAELVEQVKHKLSYSSIKKEENVIFVNFPYLIPEEERPVLVRLLNINFHGGYFIVVNLKEVVYIPAESKITQSSNELSDWLSRVAEKHLTRTKMSKRKQVRLSFVALLQGER